MAGTVPGNGYGCHPTLDDVAGYATIPYPQGPVRAPGGTEAGVSERPSPAEAPLVPRADHLCASLMWFGLAWAMNAAAITTMSAVAIFAGSLAILGIGLIVGAWYGRARWLVLLALPLSLVVWGLSAVPEEVHLGQAANWAGEGIGETVFQPHRRQLRRVQLGVRLCLPRRFGLGIPP